MKVREIMTAEELATASLDNTLEEIANMMRDENVGAIPVLDEDDNLAGIITDRDIVVRAIAEGQDPCSCTAEEILSQELHTIEPDAELEEAAELMARHKIRRLPVVESGTIIGMISLGDISVKADDERAADALEDISEGVKPASARSGQRTQERVQGRQPQTRGAAQRTGSVDSQFNAAGRGSPGEEVAAEETEYQRESAARMGRQSGQARGSERTETSRQRPQGIRNRSAAERKGQQKVTSERDEARASGRNRHKKRAS